MSKSKEVENSTLEGSQLAEIPEQMKTDLDSEIITPADLSTRVILVLTIDIGLGKTESIKVRENDNPTSLAKEFCKEHRLNTDIVPVLSSYIEKNVSSSLHINLPSSQSGRVIPKLENNRNILGDIESFGAARVPDKFRTYTPPPGRSDGNIEAWKRVIDNIYEDMTNKEFFSHIPSISHKSKKILRSKSSTSVKRGETTDVHNRLYTDSNARVKRAKSLASTSRVLMTYLESNENLNNMNNMSTRSIKSMYAGGNWQTACSAIYPKKRPKSVYSIQTSTTKTTDSDRLGTKLYRSEMDAMKKRSRSLDLRREARDMGLLKEHTFTPKLDTNSRYISQRPFLEPELILAERHKSVELKKEGMRAKQIEKLKKQCTFQPKLTKKTLQLANKTKTRSKSMEGGLGQAVKMAKDQLFHTLYNDATSREKQREKSKTLNLKKECSFKPTISKFKNVIKADYFKKDIVKRTNLAEKERTAKLAEMKKDKEYKETNFDSSSGRRFFAPHVPKAPKKERKEKGESLVNYLNKNKKMEEIKKSAREKSEERWTEMVSKSYSMRNSMKIMEKVKKKRYEDLFHLLDSNKDGKISAKDIDISQLSSEVLDAITPLLLKIEKDELVLDFNKFCLYSDRYSKSLNVAQRNAIHGPKRNLLKNTDSSKNFTFRPLVSEKTKEIAERKRGDRQANHLIEFLYNESDTKTEMLRKRMEEKAADDIKPYSFQPEVHQFNEEIFNNGMVVDMTKKGMYNRFIKKPIMTVSKLSP